ncbi:hypothetical protein Pmani_018503 [Petrolisthes manimaculis]|uniref:Uncharacterized protein n=1 Tax=Petrolisthes manimaculis TaxID=1843537 RepID=A0AAE1PMC1_9EUCA|nr:hypothetical protein Pmani_018503 [Petrolisthes manimaculis]
MTLVIKLTRGGEVTQMALSWSDSLQASRPSHPHWNPFGHAGTHLHPLELIRGHWNAFGPTESNPFAYLDPSESI